MSDKQKPGALFRALYVIKDSLLVIRQHPEIAVYPYAATFFVSLTYPIVSTTLLAHWYQRIFYSTNVYVPDKARLILGVIGFSAFYVALVTAYFSCIVSA